MNKKLKIKDVSICLILSLLMLPGLSFAASSKDKGIEKFKPKELTTIKTFPLKQIDQKALANTVIEGGLEPPSAGATDYQTEGTPDLQNLRSMDSADSQASPNRMSADVSATVLFQAQKIVPGQVHSGQYSIVPPSNRTYQVQNIQISPRQ